MAQVPERIAAAPDAYRARAFSAAGLVATGSAAVAAGTIFGGISRIPFLAALAAVISLVFLLFSVVFYAAAGQYSRQHPAPAGVAATPEDLIKSIVGSIFIRMRIASVCALVAVAAFLVLVIATVIGSRQRSVVTLSLRSGAAPEISRVCPALGGDTLAGTMERADISGNSTFVDVQVAPGVCGRRRLVVSIARANIMAIAH